MAKGLKVKQFTAGGCYSYVLTSGKEAMIIDPHISLPGRYAGYLAKMGADVKYIIDTHTHADHFSSAAVLKKKLKAPVLMHEKAVSEVADRRLKDGDEITLGRGRFRIIYAPGHTDDTVNIYGEGLVFTADVLLIGSVGRTDFQNGSPEDMFDTLQKLKALPDDTVVMPAHDYNGKRSSTIGVQKRSNPFLSGSDRGAFIASARSKKLPEPFNIENIIRVNSKGEAAELEVISPKEARKLVFEDGQAELLDVRSASEYAGTRIRGAINVPLDTLPGKTGELAGTGHGYIVFCRTGSRSPMAADILLRSGIRSVKVMDGGIQRWEKEKLPVIKGQGGVSLERQIRIIAGSLMLTGIVLSWTTHPAFIFVSVWVACGLIFAGITDNCLMGALLMKLPYNRKAYKTNTAGTCSISQ